MREPVQAAMPDGPLWFRSAVDAWVPIVLFSHLPVVGALLATEPPEKRLMGAMVIGLVTLLPVWLLASTGYRVERDRLVVRSGPVRWRIGWAALQSIEDAEGELQSGPAFSFARLALRYGDGRTLLVSPKDRQRFLDEVERRAPHVRVDPKVRRQT